MLEFVWDHKYGLTGFIFCLGEIRKWIQIFRGRIGVSVAPKERKRWDSEGAPEGGVYPFFTKLQSID